MPAKAKAAPVVVILGEDSYLADQALEEALTTAKEDAAEVESFRGEETGWTPLLDTCRTGSLFSRRRVVVVRNAEALKGGGDVIAYLDAPNPDVRLVLLAGKPDRRKIPWKALLGRVVTISAEPPKGRAFRTFLLEEVRKRHLSLEEDAIEEILDRVGGSARRLVSELEKLESFAEGKRLKADDVSALLGRGTAPPLYRLADAFTARERREALDVLERLLAEGEAPLRILGTLHRSLRQVRGAMALREARASRDAYAPKLGVPPFKVEALIAASQAWSEKQYRKALEALGVADRRLKTSGEPRVALTTALLLALGR